MTLDEWLAAVYGHRYGMNRGRSEADFRAAVKADPALRKAAAERLASISEEVAKRCFISRTHRDIVAAALRDADAS